MNRIPKFHIVFAALFSLGLVALNFLPYLMAASSDIETFKQADREVFRVTDGGGVVTASGIASPGSLWLEQIHLFNLARASQSAVVNPEGLISTTSLMGNGNLTAGVTTYNDGASTSNIIQPIVARTLAFRVQAGTGFAVVIGTDAMGNRISETIALISTTNFNYSVNAYLGISSFTIRITTLTDVLNTNTTFYVGYSSGVGLPCRIDNSSDVVRVSSSAATLAGGGRALTTPTQYVADAARSIVYISTSLVNGLSNFTVHAISRRTIHSAKP